jgi:hypothetical protein
MEKAFNSPAIKAILSDYRSQAVVPEDCYYVFPGEDCF